MPRQLTRYLFAAITSALLSAATPSCALEAGDQTPEIDLPGTGGTPVRIARQPGKVLYLDFWASWCGPCRQSFPWMNAMQEKYKAQGLQVIGINVDAQGEDAEKFLAKMQTKFTIAYDPKGNTARLFGVKGMPTSLLIDKDGKVISQHIGFNDDSRDKMELAIQAALGGRK